MYCTYHNVGLVSVFLHILLLDEQEQLLKEHHLPLQPTMTNLTAVLQ